MKSEIFNKIYKVITSCKTDKQLDVALKYLNRAEKNGNIAGELRNDIYFNVYLDKFYELNN